MGLKFLSLKTPRLILTELSIEDTNSIFELFSNKAVVKYYDLAIFDNAVQAENLINFFQSRFNEGLGIRWAIRLKETQQLVGTCGFNSWNAAMKNASIGYDLMQNHWGNGLASEAVDAIISIAFSGKLSVGKLHRIQADTVPGNTASEALLLKLGFKEEGIRRQSAYWENQFHDLKCFGLIQPEYAEKTSDS